jgi:hypothetical protein
MTDADIEIVIHELPANAPLAALTERLRAVLELYPAPSLQVDAGGPGRLLLEELRPLGARALPKGPISKLVRKMSERPTYAEAFVRQYAELVARRVHVQRNDSGEAVITFAGRTETVPMGKQIEAEVALRALAEAVDRLFHATEEFPI